MSEEDVVLKICASKEPGYTKKVASAIGWRLRDVGFCKMRSVKEASTNTAIKAIAICNQRVALAEVVLGMDLSFSRVSEATAIEILVEDVGQGRPEKTVEFRVSGKNVGDSLNGKLAEAISQSCLDGNRVSMKCIGPAAVYRAIIASTLAKGVIFSNGLSAIVVPTWSSLPSEVPGKEISLISIDFWGLKKKE